MNSFSAGEQRLSDLKIIHYLSFLSLFSSHRTVDGAIMPGKFAFHCFLCVQPLPVERPPHPAGIVLTRPGYYTDPSMDELATMVDENGDCLVEDLTIGREGYGSVFFPGTINVAGMNLDEIGNLVIIKYVYRHI